MKVPSHLKGAKPGLKGILAFILLAIGIQLFRLEK